MTATCHDWWICSPTSSRHRSSSSSRTRSAPWRLPTRSMASRCAVTASPRSSASGCASRSPPSRSVASGVVEFVILGVVLALFVVAAVVAFVKAPTRRELPPSGQSPSVEVPPTGEMAAPGEAATDVAATATATPSPVIDLDQPPPSAGRLVRLRSRLSRSQSTLGRGLLTLLARDTIDEETWEEVEDTLLTADVGVSATQQIVEALRTQVKVLGARTPDQVRTMLRDQLLVAVGADGDRALHTAPHDGRPAVLLMVGVNGTG